MRRRGARAGDWVEVRSKEEILESLDESGQLDGMPFMPQMLEYCGKRFRVFKHARENYCDTVNGLRGLRLEDTVHLERLRCDGAAYGGCQAGCLLFWKTAWLNRVRRAESALGSITTHGVTEPRSLSQDDGRGPGGACLGGDSREGAGGPQRSGVCVSATRLPYAAQPLVWWDVRQYIEDYTSRNVTMWQMFRGLAYVCYYNLSQVGIGLGRPMRWFYDEIQALWGGVPFPRRGGTISLGSPTPTCTRIFSQVK